MHKRHQQGHPGLLKHQSTHANKSILQLKSKLGDIKQYLLSHTNYLQVTTPIYTLHMETENTRSTDASKPQPDTFQRAAASILLLAQCFGVMPVYGLLEPSAKKLQFIWLAPQTIYALIILVICFIPVVAILLHLSTIGISTHNFEGIMFYSWSEFACLLFFLLARRWPRVMRHWERTENIFLNAPYVTLTRNLNQRIRPAAYIVLLLSFVEHVLYQNSEVLTYVRERKICASISHNTSANFTIAVESSFSDFIERKHKHYLSLLPNHVIVGIFLLTINFICTFTWNYMDLFIFVVSKGIAYRFEQITLHIKSLRGQATIAENEFIQVREHYVKLCKLLELLEEHISSIVLLTCINNLYFICSQLLNVFNQLQYPINYIYYWYSLVFLIGRSGFVLLTAARINDESKSALKYLRRIPSSSWCIELERLMFEMRTQTVALSGKKFYFITRSLIFGMAGTIVTYELVLLQIDEPSRKNGTPDFCI